MIVSEQVETNEVVEEEVSASRCTESSISWVETMELDREFSINTDNVVNVDDERNESMEVQIVENGTVTADEVVDDDVVYLVTQYDPQMIPDKNDLLEQFTGDWRGDWGNCVKNGMNKFRKDIDAKNYDPWRERVIGNKKESKYRIVVRLSGLEDKIPGGFLEEMGLLMARRNGVNKRTRKWYGFMGFGNERFEVVRRKVGRPEQVNTHQGTLFEASFSKPGVINQYKKMTIEAELTLDKLETDNINELDIDLGKRMLKEARETLEWLDEEIIPTSTNNLKETVREMSHLKIQFCNNNQHEFEYFDANGRFVVAKSPPHGDKTQERREKELENWLAENMQPLLNSWAEKLVDKLPIGMEALATFVGLDMELFAIQPKNRGQCIDVDCGDLIDNHYVQRIHLIHIRYGTGTLLISIEGLGKEAMIGTVPGPDIIPEGAACVPPTSCELEGADSFRAMLRVVCRLFFIDETATVVSAAFGAKENERKLLNGLLQYLFGHPIPGCRVAETSLMRDGSLPSLSMQDVKYEDEGGAHVVRSASGIQCNLVHERRMTEGLFRNALLQGTLTLKDVGKNPEDSQNRHTLLYLLYHKEDSSLCLNMIILSAISIMLQSPLLVATGAVNFIRELCQMLPELVARSTVTDRASWMVDVEMPPLNRVVCEVLDIIAKPGLLQIEEYKNGCYVKYNIPASTEFCISPKLNLQKMKIRTGKTSRPDIAEGKKKRKSKEKSNFYVQDNETTWGDPRGIVMIGEARMMQSCDNFEMSEDNFAVEADTASSQKRGGEASDINRDVSRRAEEPKSKRQVIFQEDDGTLIENKNQNLEKASQLLPGAEDIVGELEKKRFLTSDEAKDLSRKIQEKVDAVTEMNLPIVNRRSEVAVKNQKEIRDKEIRIEKMKEEAVKNNAEIQKLLEKQGKINMDVKKAQIELMTLRKRESDRKTREREEIAKEYKDASDKAIEGGTILMTEVHSKDLDKFGNVANPNEEIKIAVPRVILHEIAPLGEKVTPYHLADRVPKELKPYEQKFLVYAYWRWSFIELVKTIILILDKIEDVIKEFDGTKPEEAVGDKPAVEGTGKYAEKYKHGAFHGLSQLSKIRSKVSERKEIHYHASRRLVSIVKMLAEVHLDGKDVEDNFVIDPAEPKALQSEKKQANADRECMRYLKEFAGKFSNACQEVTGQGLVMPWPCLENVDSHSEELFREMATDIAVNKTRETNRTWTDKDGKRYLEVKVTTFVYPGRAFVRAETEENLNKNLGISDKHIDGEQQSQNEPAEWNVKDAGKRTVRLLDQ